MPQAPTDGQADRLRVRRLRCEGLRDPLGIDERRPRLSWAVEGHTTPRVGRVLVATDLGRLGRGRADLWDSGALRGTLGAVVYDGRPLTSRQPALWTVEVTAADGQVVRAATATWETGLLGDADWHARWIGLPWTNPLRDGRPCPHLRRAFDVGDELVAARLYASALGAYRLWIDGRELTADRLAPGWTDYRQRVPYRTYDATSLLRPGPTVIGALLGEAWYSGRVGFHDQRERYGPRPHLRLQLELVYRDGRRERVVTDGSWRGTFGVERRSDLLLGEIQDLRRHPAGWTRPGFDDGSWSSASVDDPDVGPMSAARIPAVRVTDELPPHETTRPWPGVQVVDLGQNAAGWVRVRAEGPSGREVLVRHAEVLDASGALYRANLRRADAVDRYVIDGGTVTLEPSFTAHGFRYVEIDADPGVEILDVTGRVAHSDLERVGRFTCSDPLVQRIHDNVVWSQRSNAVEVPTDCPQRDERLGWTGDGVAFAPTAMFSYDLAAWYADWLREVRLAQADDGSFPDVAPLADSPANRLQEGAPGWGDAGVTVPWDHYVWYGDRRVLEESYPAARRWVDLVAGRNPDGIWRHRRGHDYGDWLAIEPTSKELLATAFLSRSASLVAAMACVLGDADGVNRYRRRAEQVRKAFADRYVQADGRLTSDTQAAYAIALRFGLVPAGLRGAAGRRLAANVERHRGITTGYLGTPHLLHALTDVGRTDLAYRLITSERFPSLGYAVRRGATTIWERWDGWTEERGFHEPWMNSFNHCTLGAVADWLHATVGGIAPDPDGPGFARVRVAPIPGGGMTFAEASLDTVRGTVSSRWELAGDRLVLDVTLPATAAATVRVPNPSGSRVVPPPTADRIGDESRFRAGPGAHRFEVTGWTAP